MLLQRILIGSVVLLPLGLVVIVFAPLRAADDDRIATTESAAEAPVVPSSDIKRFFACTSDAECIVVEGECPGKAAINKAFRVQAETHFIAVRPLVDCVGPDPRRKQPDRAVCTDRRCTLAK